MRPVLRRCSASGVDQVVIQCPQDTVVRIVPGDLYMRTRPHIASQPVEIIEISKDSQRTDQYLKQAQRLQKDIFDKVHYIFPAKFPSIVGLIHEKQQRKYQKYTGYSGESRQKSRNGCGQELLPAAKVKETGCKHHKHRFCVSHREIDRVRRKKDQKRHKISLILGMPCPHRLHTHKSGDQRTQI